MRSVHQGEPRLGMLIKASPYLGLFPSPLHSVAICGMLR